MGPYSERIFCGEAVVVRKVMVVQLTRAEAVMVRKVMIFQLTRAEAVVV